MGSTSTLFVFIDLYFNVCLESATLGVYSSTFMSGRPGCHSAVLSQQPFQPKPLEELTVEQPPDDVEIEPDEQTDAFTVSLSPVHTLIAALGVTGSAFRLSE